MRHKFQSHAYSFFSETYWKKFGEDGGRNKKKKPTRIRLDFFFYVHVCSVVSDSLQPNADSSAYGISQAKILEWVTMPSSRGSPWPRDWTHVSCTAGRFFTTEPPGKPCFCVVFCKFNHLSLFSQMYCDMIDKWKLCVCSVQHGVLIYLCALWKITKIELN